MDVERNPNEYQIGGSHYASAMQHWDIVEKYGVGYLEAAATKYVTRWRSKAGVQDVRKAVHYAVKLRDLHVRQNRQPRGIVPGRVIETFAEANGLAPLETHICIKLFRWEAVQDLDVVIELLQDLERVAEAEAA